MGIAFRNGDDDILAAETWSQRGYQNKIAVECQSVINALDIAKQMKMKSVKLLTDYKDMVFRVRVRELNGHLNK